jgi:hypothetical protein
MQYADAHGVFTCEVPGLWKQVEGLDPGGGLLGSWYNPYEPGAETLAVYRTPTPDTKDTRGLGTPEVRQTHHCATTDRAEIGSVCGLRGVWCFAFARRMWAERLRA